MAECLLLKNGGGINSDDLTATKAQVLSGYTAMTNDSDDDVGTGTMPNRGAVNQSLNAGGSYTIPQGYHNGSGEVRANSLASQTSGNANASHILTGHDAWVNGSHINGSMPNRGSLNFNPSSSTSQSVSAGYYSGGTLSSANAYNAGYNKKKIGRLTFTSTQDRWDNEPNKTKTALGTVLFAGIESSHFTVYSWKENFNHYAGVNAGVSWSGNQITLNLSGGNYIVGKNEEEGASELTVTVAYLYE